MDDSTKWCNRCGEEKPLTAFGKQKLGWLGRRAVCNSCRRDEYAANREAVRQQQRAYYQANRERIIAKVCGWQQEHREERLVYLRRYQADNREQILAKQAEYRAANRELLSLKAGEWAKANPERRRTSNRLRKYRLRGADGSHTFDDLQTKYREQNGLCYWCEIPLGERYEVDHIVPISRGGGNGPGNICCSCEFCNRSKANKMPWEFADRLF